MLGSPMFGNPRLVPSIRVSGAGLKEFQGFDWRTGEFGI